MPKIRLEPGLDFENWICDSLPKQLNLSASKETAVKIKFGGFADYVRQITRVAPKEFEIFFSELVKKFDEITKWKAPNGKRCIKGFGLLNHK